MANKTKQTVKKNNKINNDFETIICPKCQTKIEITEVLTEKIKGSVAAEYEKQLKEKTKQLAQEQKEYQAEYENKLKKQKAELSKLEAKYEEEYLEKIASESKKLETKITEKIKKESELEFSDLKEQLKEQEVGLKKAREAELTMRKKQRELEESKKNMELEMTRKLDNERKQMETAIRNSLGEEQEMKLAEKEKQLSDLKKQLTDAQRKAELGSQQLQGEVQELALEDLLTTQFVYDKIKEVPKGVNGADVYQEVCNNFGQSAGHILWESKRTKNWTDSWVGKLKEDQRAVSAEIAVIVSKELPKDIKSFGLKDGVWICDFTSVSGLAAALRQGLLEVAAVKQSQVGKNEKMEIMYQYLSGPQFKGRIESIVEAFSSMKNDLEKEKRAMTKIWSKREKQIDMVIYNTIGMHGDLQGIVGKSLPDIKMLELDVLTDDEQ